MNSARIVDQTIRDIADCYDNMISDHFKEAVISTLESGETELAIEFLWDALLEDVGEVPVSVAQRLRWASQEYGFDVVKTRGELPVKN